MANRNAEIVLQYSTLYPFRLRGKTLMCVYCCDEIEDPDEYRRHMDEMHKTVDVFTAFAHVKCRNRLSVKDFLKVDCINLKCRLCDEPCDTVTLVAQHLKDRHDNVGIKDIDLNYEVSLYPFRLIKDKWICMVCNTKLPTLTKLTRHMSSHFADNVCKVCDKSYLTVQSLKYHIKFNHSKDHICRKCRMKFSTAEERKEHLKASSKCWGFVCIHCKERFSSWEYKQAHLASKHNVKASTYTCPDCGTTFQSSSNFYYHYNTLHTDLPHMCSYCGMRYGKKCQLANHLSTHSDEKHFQCNVCSKAFATRKGLRDHMRRHHESKVFKKSDQETPTRLDK